MEKNNNLKELYKFLEPNEVLLWNQTKGKKGNLGSFYLLTDERWIQKTKLLRNIDPHIKSLLPIKNNVIYIRLKDIKVITTTNMKKTYSIRFFLNWDEDRSKNRTFLGVEIPYKGYLSFMSILKKFLHFDRKLPLKDQKTIIWYIGNG